MKLAQRLLFGLFFCFLCSRAFAGDLLVYTALEPELLQPVAKDFQAEHPDIRIKWIRDSTGPITTRLLAEKDKPKAQVVFGLAATSVAYLQTQGIVQPYVSPVLLPRAGMQDPKSAWTPLDALGTALCVNTKELEKRHLPMPTDWRDLLDPQFAGLIVMSNPLSSNIGQMHVRGWLQIMGDQGGWDYMEQLDKNIRMYVHSGCKPCQMAATGEAVIGISSNTCAGVYMRHNAPLQVVYPQSGVSWDMEVAALLVGGTNDVEAKKLIDFAASSAFAEIMESSGYIPAQRDVALSSPLQSVETLFLPESVASFADQRDEMLQNWRQRFSR